MLRARRLKDDRGTAVIEFALLTPVFLLLLTGMLAYGLYFGAAHALQQLAADAARIAIAGLTDSERDAMVGRYLTRHAGDYMLIDPGRLSYEIGAYPGDPDQYQVLLRYDAAELPIWNLYPPLPLPASMLVSGASIRRGGL